MLAIVIPFYKIEFFKECLESLATQTHQGFNLYIGNDFSPDDPSELISEFRERLTLTYKVFEKNLGSISLTQHWDRCIKMTREEEWVMILGDDDVLEQYVVEEFYKNYSDINVKVNVIRFATLIIDENTQKTSKVFTHPQWEMPGDSAFRRICAHTRSSLSEHIFKKEVYKKHGFYNFPLAWHSDDRAWLEFTEGKHIFTINEAIVYIRNSALNISGKTDNEEEKYTASLAYYRYLLQKQLHQFTKPQKLEVARKHILLVQKSRPVNFAEWIRVSKIYILNADQKAYLHILRLLYYRLKVVLERKHIKDYKKNH
tara:strand:- start:19070 stop:20011 length:942 start_codon:yes stop_codon:yes gene_type:complete